MKKKRGVMADQIDVAKGALIMAKAIVKELDDQGMFKEAEKKFIDKWTDHFVVMKRVGRLSRRNIEGWIRKMLKEFKETQT